MLLACESSIVRMGPKWTSDFWTLHDLFLPSAKEQAEINVNSIFYLTQDIQILSFQRVIIQKLLMR